MFKRVKGVVFLLFFTLALSFTSSVFTQAGEAKYEKVDQKELYIIFEAELTSLRVGADNKVKAVDGVIKRMAIGKNNIELTSDKFIMEGAEIFVGTKKYGKVKISIDSNAQTTFWLTPVQKKELLKLKK